MMDTVFGRPGAMCMAAAIMISTFGCNNGLILAGARVYYAMARDGLFFRKIATTNRFHVPAAAFVAQGIWTVLLVLPRTVTTNPATHQVDLRERLQSTARIHRLSGLGVLPSDGRRCHSLATQQSRMLRGHTARGVIQLYRSSRSCYLALLTIDLAWLAPATSGIGILIVLTGVPGLLLLAEVARRRNECQSGLASTRNLFVCLQNQRNNKWQPALRLRRSEANAPSRRLRAHRQMDDKSMSESELRRMAKTKRKGKPTRKKRR